MTTLHGFRELEAALSELPRATGKNVLRRVARGALEPLADAASGHAPIGTGKLSFNIIVSEKRTRRARFTGLRGGLRTFRSDPSTGIEMAMGPGTGQGVTFYASFVEFGTVDTPAQPYMRPAWDSGQGRALEYIKDSLGTEIDRAARRHARRLARATR